MSPTSYQAAPPRVMCGVSTPGPVSSQVEPRSELRGIEELRRVNRRPYLAELVPLLQRPRLIVSLDLRRQPRLDIRADAALGGIEPLPSVRRHVQRAPPPGRVPRLVRHLHPADRLRLL